MAVLCLQCALGDDSLEALLVLTPSPLLPKGESPFATTFCRLLSAVPWQHSTTHLLAFGAIFPLTVRRWPGLRPKLVHTGPWGTWKQRC